MTKEDWQCHGWDDHEIFHLETGRRMTFLAKLQWLEGADRMVRFLARKRRWIDKDGVIHEATGEVEPLLAVAEEPVGYPSGAPKRGGGTPPTS